MDKQKKMTKPLDRPIDQASYKLDLHKAKD